MRYLCTAVTLGAMVLAATTAWAQLGLYGAPAPIGYPQMATATLPYGQTNVPAAAPAIRPLPSAYAVPYGARVPVHPESAPKLPKEPPPPKAPDASPSDAPNPVEQMLNEVQGGGCYAPASCDPLADCNGYGCGGCEGCSPCEAAGPGWLSRAVGRFEQSMLGDCGCGCDVGCGACGTPCYPWYASVSALTLSRDKPNKIWTSYRTGSEEVQLYHTQDLDMSWNWGGEVRLGRKFCRDTCGGTCYRFGLEVVYWTIDPMDERFVGTDPAGVSTPLTVGQVEFDGTSATAWFDAALEHRLRRENEFHNLELNLIRYAANCDPCGTWSLEFLGGFRYFRFDERLVFGTLADPTNLPDPGTTPDEAFIDDDITNDLYGFQIGLHADYRVLGCVSLFVEPKVGIYNNHIDHTFRMYLEDGTVADTGSSGMPGTYPVSSSENVLSFLTQIDVGGKWQISPRLSAALGYRVICITGVGLADNQIPPYVVDIPEIADIDHNGDLVLHGAFANMTFAF